MRALFDVELNESDVPMDAEALAAAVQRADCLVPTVTDRIDAALIAKAGPQLRMIANFGAGTDHIDLPAADARGLVVSNTPNVLTDDTADIAMLLMLAAARLAIEGSDVLHAGGFKGWHPTWMMGTRLGGKTLGIIGMGRIGQAVARRARAFGMAIHSHNRKPIPAPLAGELGAHYWEDLDGMLARSDFVSVNCPYTPGTRHLLSAERLGRMKPGAILVNTARGAIIDEAALADALEAGTIAAAGLDVFEFEPKVHPKLLTLKNAVLLPHLGSGTIEGRVEMGEKVIINIKTFFDHHRPPDRVLPSLG